MRDLVHLTWVVSSSSWSCVVRSSICSSSSVCEASGDESRRSSSSDVGDAGGGSGLGIIISIFLLICRYACCGLYLCNVWDTTFVLFADRVFMRNIFRFCSAVCGLLVV